MITIKKILSETAQVLNFEEYVIWRIIQKNKYVKKKTGLLAIMFIYLYTYLFINF